MFGKGSGVRGAGGRLQFSAPPTRRALASCNANTRFPQGARRPAAPARPAPYVRREIARRPLSPLRSPRHDDVLAYAHLRTSVELNTRSRVVRRRTPRCAAEIVSSSPGARSLLLPTADSMRAVLLLLVALSGCTPGPAARRHAPDLREDEPARRTTRPAVATCGVRFRVARSAGRAVFARHRSATLPGRSSRRPEGPPAPHCYRGRRRVPRRAARGITKTLPRERAARCRIGTERHNSTRSVLFLHDDTI
ncbi:hypothetical protein EVAR_82377_1 [Eumeta japonica]|uniref:Uncharacterized protein n=1 Tax=Eumeta variegata TaxID=151549 RepID=A0A4C1UA01_EUMVA|nr:hypothetical protein EVAR_82377_1 [Eumeta japonica]